MSTHWSLRCWRRWCKSNVRSMLCNLTCGEVNSLLWLMVKFSAHEKWQVTIFVCGKFSGGVRIPKSSREVWFYMAWKFAHLARAGGQMPTNKEIHTVWWDLSHLPTSSYWSKPSSDDMSSNVVACVYVLWGHTDLLTSWGRWDISHLVLLFVLIFQNIWRELANEGKIRL